MAYSDREVYLVEVVGKLIAKKVGTVLYNAYLFHHDPDYVEHRDKQVHLIILARDATASLRDCAQCHGIRVMVLRNENALEPSDSRECMNQSDQKSEAVPAFHRPLLSSRSGRLSIEHRGHWRGAAW